MFFSDSPTPDHFSQLVDARRTLSLHFAVAVHLDLNTLAGRIFESGDTNSKLLENLVSDSKMQTVVSEMCCSDGRVVSDAEQILNEFRAFYENLYTAVPGWLDERLGEYLQSLNLPTLSQSDLELLERDFTGEEIEASLENGTKCMRL